MKQVFRSQLTREQADVLVDSRFVLIKPNPLGASEIISHGNNPVEVARGGKDAEVTPGTHKLDPSGAPMLIGAELYRIDEG